MAYTKEHSKMWFLRPLLQSGWDAELNVNSISGVRSHVKQSETIDAENTLKRGGTLVQIGWASADKQFTW